MAGGGGVGDGEEEKRIVEDRVYFISTNLGGDVVGAEEDGEEDHENDGAAASPRQDLPIRVTLGTRNYL